MNFLDNNSALRSIEQPPRGIFQVSRINKDAHIAAGEASGHGSKFDVFFSELKQQRK